MPLAQIWIAIGVYVLVAIIKKRLNIHHSLYTILQVLSVGAFEKMPLIALLTDSDSIHDTASPETQLTFLD